MRHVIFLDKKIDKKQFEDWKKEDVAFWGQHCDITPTYWTIDYNFENYPVTPDPDGDAKPTEKFLEELTEIVHTKYSSDGTDFIMLFIHEDNWQSSGANFEAFKIANNITKAKGIWGTNWSNKYRNYHVEYCRWDKKNQANNFGTMYHERHHALDALIKTETGVDVNPMVYVRAWDAGCTHGGEAVWSYIRHKENTESIETIAPYLREALKKRQDRHTMYIKGQQKVIIGLLEKVIYLWRKKLNTKDGINIY